MIILVFAAALLFASDRLAQARLQRPRPEWLEPSAPVAVRRVNEGGRVRRPATDARLAPPVSSPRHFYAGFIAAEQTASHL